MMYSVLGVGVAVFFGVALKKFNWALGFLIVAFPAYVVRLKFGSLPSTLLEVVFGVVFLAWLILYVRVDLPVLFTKIREHRYFFALFALFFVASLLGVAVSDMVILSFGQWRAYFLEPMVLFLILVARSRALSPGQLVWPLAISTLSLSVYAVVQKFTGFGIATPEWTAAATRRVTAFYTSPNAVALYLAPLIFLGVAFAAKLYKENKQREAGSMVVIVAASLMAIAFTFSQGALIALAAGFVVFIALIGYKKSALFLVGSGVVLVGVLVFSPNALPLHYKSAGNRVILWRYSQEFLTASPKNFVLGAGVRQFFRKIQKPYYDVKKLERLIYPHNIFLNFWTETGLLGMLSFASIYAYMLHGAYVVYRQGDKIWGAGLVAMLVVFFVHGLIDVPYFKNDLAMLFWVLAALVLLFNTKNNETMQR